MKIFLLLIAIISNVLSSSLLKNTSLLITESWSIHKIKIFLMFLAALSLLGITFICYTYLLKTWPLSTTYAILTFTTQILLMAVGYFFFKEEISFNSYLGMLFISIGLFFMAQSSMGQK